MRTTASGSSIGRPLLAGGVATAVWMALVIPGVGSDRLTQLISNLGQCAAALVAAVLCWAGSRAREEGSRTFWRLLSAGALSWAVGQGVWTVYESFLGREVPFPSAADVGYLGCSVLLAAALLSISRGGQGRTTQVRSLLDGLLIAASLLLSSWIVVLEPVYRASDASTVSRVVSLGYPVLDVVVMTLLLYVQIGSRRAVRTQPVTFGLLSLGLLGVSVADSLFAWGTADGWYSSGSFVNAGWVAGFLLVGLAGLSVRSADEASLETVGTEHSYAVLLPYTALLLALTLVVVDFARSGVPSAPVFALELFIVGAILVRQVMTLRENHALARGLESRVHERTAQLAASEQRFRALVRNSSDVTTMVDLDGTVLYVSESANRVFGHDPEALVGADLTHLVTPTHRKLLTEAIARVVEAPAHPQTVEIPVTHRDGRALTVEIVVTNLAHEPAVGAIVLNARDVTAQRAVEAELRHQAFHDSLTSLANRALFRDRLEHRLAGREADSVFVLYLDVDGFKEINDTLGHTQGDVLLVEIADRLKPCVRTDDTIARLGGDEFAILLERSSVGDATLVAERIERALEEPFAAVSGALEVRASVGIATSGEDALDAETLLRNADLAMYEAKATRTGHALYEPALHDELVERMTISTDLRRALERDELLLHYQPTIALGDGHMEGVEALVRWQHPTRGLLAPGVFIPIAERTGLIRQVGRWVLRTACAQAAAWHHEQPDRPLVMNVNVTVVELLAAGFVDGVREALATSGLPPGLLVLELTESSVMEESDECRRRLEEVRALGVRIAIDDFGTGYSSLSYVHQLPVDILKIDRSFIDQVASLGRNGEIVQTIVALGKSLDLVTVAEGIETAEQLHALESLGCDLGQGFLFARPLTAEQIGELLRDTSGRRAA